MTTIDIDVSLGGVTAVSVPATTTSQVIASGRCWLVGWSLRETTGAAGAGVEFTSGGNPVGESSIGQGGSDTHNITSDGVGVPSDLTLNVVSGSVRGVVYVRLAF